MRYCTHCILPDTRPGITLNGKGVCSACVGGEEKNQRIDWSKRSQKLEQIVAEAKDRSNGYDCIVPVSGGKDSWCQVLKCQELGLKVLGITWRTPARTTIGQQNLDNMIQRLGIDHIDYTINPDAERRFMKAAFERRGAVGLAMHMALFSIPIRLATQLHIPLIVWGENPQLEYGGEEEERLSTVLDATWLSKHGCLQSTTADDWVGVDGLTKGDLAPYQLPEASGSFAPMSIFLGAFMKWDSFENARIATEHGFRSNSADQKTGVWSFADIDCDFISLHHFLKWYKFGFTRAFDNLSVQIRCDRISRNDAIAILKDVGIQTPHEDISRFSDFCNEPESWFWGVSETFRDHEIWKRRGPTWIIEDFLIPDWAW